MKTIRLFSKFPESQLPVVLSNEAFFITEVLEKIDNFTDRELEVMKEIDGITFIKGQYIETKFGSTHISKISTGLKTYLNLSILQRLNIPATVYITEAGPNVLKYIFEDIDTDFFNLVLTHGEIPDVEKYHFIVNGEEILNPDDMYGMGGRFIMIECFERLYDLSNGKSFLLQLPNRMTMVYMNSGTGKSYVVEHIKGMKINHPTEYDDTILISSEDAVESFLHSQPKDKIIIIDQYDFYSLRHPQLREKILEIFSDNYFLIFARGCIRLPIRPSDYAEMIFNKEKNQFKLFYRFSMTMRDDLRG